MILSLLFLNVSRIVKLSVFCAVAHHSQVWIWIPFEGRQSLTFSQFTDLVFLFFMSHMLHTTFHHV